MTSPKSSTPLIRKNIKQACDGCKIRKIKCSELPPCDGCRAAGIPCTKKNKPGVRGPRSLRAKTFKEIAKRQQMLVEGERDGESRIWDGGQRGPLSGGYEDLNEFAPSWSPAPQPRTPMESLILCLHEYRQRLFPVWPIVDVTTIIGTLRSEEGDTELYALANAIGAATIAQLKLDVSGMGTADIAMEAECQRVRNVSTARTSVNLDTLRIPFFLHVYHENQQAGGIKSLLYLREAITLAQIMSLHCESSYTSLPPSEQQIRRRVFWLLFVTERGVAMLHKLPVVLKPSTLFPSTDDSSGDDSQILPAFEKLASLFWIFDQSGAFDILQNESAAFNGGMESANRNCLEVLQKRLQDVPLEREPSNDIQRADICVTRSWMRAVLWRASMSRGKFSSLAKMASPVIIAREFLSVISKVPRGAIEAHGPSMELKIFEIANAVMDAMSNTIRTSWISPASPSPRHVVNCLHRILVSCRGGNKTLVSLLCDRIAEVHGQPQLLLEPSPRVVDVSQEWFPGGNFGSGVELMAGFTRQQHDLSRSGQDDDGSGDNTAPETFDGMLQNPLQSSSTFAWETEMLNNLHNLVPAATMRDDGFG